MTLTAVAETGGNAITLTWPGDDEGRFRLIGRRGAYPAPDGDTWIGQVVVEDSTSQGAPTEVTPDGMRVRHGGLPAETVHYYQLLTAEPGAATPAWVADPAGRASAMATGPYGFGELLHRMLPAVHRRYDTATAPDGLTGLVPENLRDAGQLRRFLELPGGELDRVYSTVRSLSGLTDVRDLDGRLLPLLAQWIGWRLDHGLGHDVQRRQIADAPAVFRVVQTVAALQAAARRVTGWGCTVKEMTDVAAVTNRPEQLNLWQVPLDGDTPEMLSSDAGPSRPAIVALADRTVRMVYTTAAGELREKVRAADGTWSPSVSLRPGPDRCRATAAAVSGDEVLLFWSAHRPGDGWRVEFRRLRRGRWSPVRVVDDGGAGAERCDPAAVVEGDGDRARLWLFWRERTRGGGPWRLRHRRAPFAGWAPDPDGVRDVPPAPDGTAVPVDAAPSALLHDGRLWLWWARRVPGGTGTVWRCALRVKDGPHGDDDTGWGDVVDLAGVDGRHDEDPVGAVVGGGPTVLFGSTRDGSRSVWRVPVDAATGTWGEPVAVTGGASTDRCPAVIDAGTPSAAVVYRSSRGIGHAGGRGVDRRPSGATTLRTTDTALLALRGTEHDVVARTWDTRGSGARIEGRPEAGPVAADVVALHLDPGEDAGPDAVDAGIARLTAVLPEFLPISVRATLVVRRTHS